MRAHTNHAFYTRAIKLGAAQGERWPGGRRCEAGLLLGLWPPFGDGLSIY